MKPLQYIFIFISIMLISSVQSISYAKSIGIAYYGESGMSNRVIDGFKQRIKHLTKDIDIEYKLELKNEEELAKIVRKWEKTKDGMILTRSTAARWLSKNKVSIPTFIGACNNPVYLGAVKSFDKPLGNTTGVTYYLPKKEQFDIFKAIIPHMKSVHLLLEKNHPSSIIDKIETIKECKKRNIRYTETACATKEEVIDAIISNRNKVNAIILGSQNLLLEMADEASKYTNKTPLLAYSSKPVKSGALGGFVADDHKLGRLLADSVYDVLYKNKNIKNIPIKTDPNPQLYINKTTANKLGIIIPNSILKSATVIK